MKNGHQSSKSSTLCNPNEPLISSESLVTALSLPNLEEKNSINFLNWISKTLSNEQDSSILDVPPHTVHTLEPDKPSFLEKTSNAIVYFMKSKDKNRLFLTNFKVPSSYTAWTLNKALLKSAFKRTSDASLQKQIAFLSTNYLGTVAPVYMDFMSTVLPSCKRFFQVNPEVHFSYHRYGFMENLHIASSINQSFALSTNSPFIPTDTDEFKDFLPLSFNVLNMNNEADWDTIVYQIIKSHFQNKSNNEILKHGFLFDLTDYLKILIQTNKNKDKEKEFEEQFETIQVKIKESIKKSITLLSTDFPEISKQNFKEFINKHCIPICRVYHNESAIAGVKILPIFSNLEGNKLFRTHHAFLDFLSNTGLFIGAVNMRRLLIDSFEEGKGIDYAIEKGNKDALFFKNKDTFINSNLFKEISEKIQLPEYVKNHPHIAVLMSSMIKMLKGLFFELSNEQWESLNQEGAKREILQTTLFKLQEHLAMADFHAKTNFVEFTKSMELAHAELSILLELMRPFNKEDFSQIFKNNLNIVPEIFQNTTFAGLGRTGVNLFAAINVAIQSFNPTPLRVYGEGFYFEQAGFLGEDNKIEEVLKDPEKAKKVDLYACQFNPNIAIESDHHHYKVANIKKDIEHLLKDRVPNIDPPLTVAIDCTIDFIQSKKVKKLLKNFQFEIEKGKINVICFRSGQKLDMYGTDFYYGSSYFMINNGDPKWEPYKAAFKSPGVQIDPLSLQWFCLANKYASKDLDKYRKLIFTNSRKILEKCPEKLKYNSEASNKQITVSTVDKDMDVCFIDIKVKGMMHKLKALSLLCQFYLKAVDNGIKVHSRASFGFPHLNFIVMFIHEVPDSTTIRLSPGINPEENKLVLDFLEKL